MTVFAESCQIWCFNAIKSFERGYKVVWNSETRLSRLVVLLSRLICFLSRFIALLSRLLSLLNRLYRVDRLNCSKLVDYSVYWLIYSMGWLIYSSKLSDLLSRLTDLLSVYRVVRYMRLSAEEGPDCKFLNSRLLQDILAQRSETHIDGWIEKSQMSKCQLMKFH